MTWKGHGIQWKKQCNIELTTYGMISHENGLEQSQKITWETQGI